MNITIGQPRNGSRLHRLGLRDTLRNQAGLVGHIKKISVPASVKLVGSFQFYAAFAEQFRQGPVHNGRSQLRFYIITDDRDLLLGKTGRPGRITGDKNRDIVNKGNSSFKGTLGIKPGRFLRTCRQEVKKNF